jgi:hypothetical protein
MNDSSTAVRDGYHFRSSLFDIEAGEDAGTNPGCYGKQLAHWLKARLASAGYTAVEVIPEDWGWCVMCQRDPFLLWVGCGNVQEDFDQLLPEGAPPQAAEVVWHCFPEAEQPLLKRLFGRIDTGPALDKLDADLRAILSSESGIEIVPEA